MSFVTRHTDLNDSHTTSVSVETFRRNVSTRICRDRPLNWYHLLATLLTPVTLISSSPAWALPPAQDTPEEVLRTEIILDARSPIDGKPMDPAQYAALQVEQQAPYHPPAPLAPKVRSTVKLLKVRKFIKTYLPFIPIK